MSDLDHFAAFCQRMGPHGLRSITVDTELARRLRADADALRLVAAVDPLGDADFNVAGVNVLIEEPVRPTRRLSPEELQATQRERNRQMSRIVGALNQPDTP